MASAAHASPSSSVRASKSKPLTMLPLVVLVFFEVSGGPFGTEDAVRAGGPLLCMLGYLILPFFWSIPEALVTAELATAFPENSGYVAWVTAAFGPFWGFQEGLWSWISGVTDNSLYPVLLAANAEMFFPQLASGATRTYFVVGLSLALTYLNYRGLNVVGNAVITACLAIMIPFLLLVVLAVPYVQPSNWLKVDWETIDWPTYINVMFWNLNYWDSVSTLAGEVENPGYTFPRAMMWAVLLVCTFYFLPSMAALGVTSDPKDWTLGCYGRVAEKVGGKWLAVWILIASACSQVGQFQAEMASDSYQLQGMAERGFLPKVLAGRSKHDTPTIAIMLSSIGVLALTAFDFVQIVTLLNATYCMAALLEYAAYIWLRIKAPNLHRPYKVPLPTWALVLMLLPASLLLLVVLSLPIITGDYITLYFTIGSFLLGCTLYPLMQMASKRGWCEFEPLHFGSNGVYGPTPPEEGGSLHGGSEGSDDSELAPSMVHHNLRVESVVPGLYAIVDSRHQSLDLDALNAPLLHGTSLDSVLSDDIARLTTVEEGKPVDPVDR